MEISGIVRKPILTISCSRNTVCQPEYMDTETLLVRFEPLIKSVYKRFCAWDGMFDKPDDKEDLYAQCQYEFLRLKNSYDPKVGVDFPGYIKFHLQQRVYHYVTVQQNLKNKEKLVQESQNEDEDECKSINLENLLDEETYEDTQDEFRIVEALSSVPWDLLQEENELYPILVRSVLQDHIPLEKIAVELDIPIRKINIQFGECCNWLSNYFSEE